jgi:ABC-type phosphate transport system substrate-binding protein
VLVKIRDHRSGSLVNFAATDAPVSDEDLKAAKLTQFPIVTGGILAVTNFSTLGARRL